MSKLKHLYQTKLVSEQNDPDPPSSPTTVLIASGIECFFSVLNIEKHYKRKHFWQYQCMIGIVMESDSILTGVPEVLERKTGPME
jgi:hypothetical protein